MSMTNSFSASDQAISEHYLHYRTLSASAVAALLLGLISLPALMVAAAMPGFLIVPLVGMLVGLFAVLRLRNRTHEFSGLSAAVTGLLLATTSFFGGIGWVGYVYATEVPEGYTRVSFQDLQPDQNFPQLPISPKAIALNKQQVFIKGYVYPDGQSANIKQFVLVPDMGTCCFGGQPKLTDMVQVTLRDPQRIEYSYNQRRLSGIFQVSPYKKAVKGLDGVYYELDAIDVK
jgi:hypothetical protein